MARSRPALAAIASLLALTSCSGSASTDDRSASQPGDGTVIVVRNGTLVDGTGGAPVPGAVVIVEAGLITAAGPESQIEVPDAAQVIDAAGGTILPGLIDTHTHHLDRLRLEGGELEESTADRYLTGVVRSGVTTYRDLGSHYADRASLDDLRAAIDGLGDQAPTVVVAGPLIAREGNWALQQFPQQATAVADAPAAAATANRLLDAGVDQIKIMVENAEFTGNPTPSLTAEQIDAIVEAVHARDGWVVAHVSDVAEAELALDNGADEVTHWPGNDPLPDDLIGRLASRATPVGTTFTILQPADGDVRRLLDAGGVIVVSTDAPGTMPPNGIAQEMVRMVNEGMTPMEAITAATRNGAVALGLDDRVGTIEVGKVADLVVVAGDPLANVATIADVSTVVVRGTVAFDRELTAGF